MLLIEKILNKIHRNNFKILEELINVKKCRLLIF